MFSIGSQIHEVGGFFVGFCGKNVGRLEFVFEVVVGLTVVFFTGGLHFMGLVGLAGRVGLVVIGSSNSTDSVTLS